MGVRLGGLGQPGEASCEVSQVGGRLPCVGEVAERRVEGAGCLVLHRPGQGEAALRCAAAGGCEVDLVRGEAEYDVGVGPEGGEEVDLVPPMPLRVRVG